MERNSRSQLALVFLIICISIIPLIPIWSTSLLPHTHDGAVHLARMGAYFKALKDGHFPVRWAGDLNYGYGMPLFNFMYQIPYFVSSIFIALGFSLVNTFKIVLSLSFIFSGIFVYLFTRSFFQDTQKAILASLFYQFYPFRLVELLIRGSFGEVFTYTFLPLTLYGLVSLFKRISYKSIVVTALSTFLLIISHNAISLTFFAVIILFVIFFANTKKNVYFSIFSLGLGLLLASFYWIPALVEHKYTYGDLFMKNMYKDHFPSIIHFFLPNFTNDKTLTTGGISVQLGIFQVFSLLLAFFYLVKRKTEKKTRRVFLFSILLLCTSLFFMQPISKFFWEHISFLRQFQFPWRLLSVGALATAMLAVSFLSVSFFKKKTRLLSSSCRCSFIYVFLLDSHTRS